MTHVCVYIKVIKYATIETATIYLKLISYYEPSVICFKAYNLISKKSLDVTLRLSNKSYIADEQSHSNTAAVKLFHQWY